MKNSKFAKVLKSVMLMALLAVIISVLSVHSAALVLPIMGVIFIVGMLKGIPGFNFGIKNTYGVYSADVTDGFNIEDTTYAGESATAFIVKAITSNDTVDGGHMYVKDGIKKKFTIPRWDANYEDFIQDRAPTPTSKGVMVVDGQVLNPEDYMIYTEFNPRDYEVHWFATMLNPTLIDRTLPPTVESVVIQEVLKRHDKYINKAIWNNSTTLAAPSIYRYYDGLIQKAVNNAGTVVVPTPTTLTASNIQAEFLRGYLLIPAELRYDPEMKFFCSYDTYDLYAQSQINQQFKGVDTTQEGIPTFKGRKVVKIADMPDNFYIIAKGKADQSSNMWLGLNSTEDAKLTMKPVQNNSELWFIKMNMKADVQFGWPSETILYGSYTAPTYTPLAPTT